MANTKRLATLQNIDKTEDIYPITAAAAVYTNEGQTVEAALKNIQSIQGPPGPMGERGPGIMIYDTAYSYDEGTLNIYTEINYRGAWQLSSALGTEKEGDIIGINIHNTTRNNTTIIFGKIYSIHSSTNVSLDTVSHIHGGTDVYDWAKASSKPSYNASEVGALSTSGGEVTGVISAYEYGQSSNNAAITMDKIGSESFGIGGNGQDMTIQYGQVTNRITGNWSSSQNIIHEFKGTLRNNGNTVPTVTYSTSDPGKNSSLTTGKIYLVYEN